MRSDRLSSSHAFVDNNFQMSQVRDEWRDGVHEGWDVEEPRILYRVEEVGAEYIRAFLVDATFLLLIVDSKDEFVCPNTREWLDKVENILCSNCQRIQWCPGLLPKAAGRGKPGNASAEHSDVVWLSRKVVDKDV